MVPPLTPAEAMVLLDPGVKGAKVLKVALVTLVLQKVLVIENRITRGLLGFKKTVTEIGVSDAVRDERLPPEESVLRVVRSARSARVGDIVASARRTYGSDLRGFVTGTLVNSLMWRGLLQMQDKKVLGFLPRRSPVRTARGEEEAARLRDALAGAKTVPEFLDRDPKQAAAIAASLGGLILLVDELRPYYKSISQALRENRLDDLDDISDATADFGTDTFDGLDMDLGGFESAVFDAVDSAISSFESNFDSSTSDSGGDSGGGDSSSSDSS